MSAADHTDVAVRLGRTLTPVQIAQVEVLLDDVEALIQTRYPDLDALNQRTLIAVESYAVMRVIRNPDGKRQQSIDDYSWTTDTALSSGALYVSDDEWLSLTPIAAVSGEAFTIRPYFEPDVAQLPGSWA